MNYGSDSSFLKAAQLLGIWVTSRNVLILQRKQVLYILINYKYFVVLPAFQPDFNFHLRASKKETFHWAFLKHLVHLTEKQMFLENSTAFVTYEVSVFKVDEYVKFNEKLPVHTK